MSLDPPARAGQPAARGGPAGAVFLRRTA